MSDKIVDLDLHLMHSTDLAFLFWTGKKDDDGDMIGVWVPKSRCEDNGEGNYTMDWDIAFEKGLI